MLQWGGCGNIIIVCASQRKGLPARIEVGRGDLLQQGLGQLQIGTEGQHLLFRLMPPCVVVLEQAQNPGKALIS